ncbi:hypothetical protein CU098_010409, partial [Rhizopus stolonifer]
ECFMTLDLLEKIKKIKTTSLANNSFSDQKTSHHKPKDYKAKYEQVKQVIAQQQDMIQQLNSENEKYHGVLNANKKIYEDAMAQLEKQKEITIRDMQTKAQKSLSLIIKRHLQKEQKLKKLAFFRISTLKSEKKSLQTKQQQWEEKQKCLKEKMEKLRIKGIRLASHFTTTKSKLLNEINGLRREKKEFRELFMEFKHNLIEKGIHLDQ